MADQLDECLRALIEQCGPGDIVTVVDDASTDNTSEVARALGARAIRLADSTGPYYARQFAANASHADILLFIDGRCRPLPGLMESHRELHGRPGILLSATETRTRGGPSLAARAASRMQMFALKNYVGRPGRPDYFPTANLGIRRWAFEQAGGFRQMRSGGDADICWRIHQFAPNCMAVDTRVLMEWEPRTSRRDLLSQAYRYGKSWAYLKWVYDGYFEDQQVSRSEGLRSVATKVGGRLRALRDSPLSEGVVSLAYSAAFSCGYSVAKGQRADFEAPRFYTSRVDG